MSLRNVGAKMPRRAVARLNRIYRNDVIRARNGGNSIRGWRNFMSFSSLPGRC
jgi:hypothetical protein